MSNKSHQERVEHAYKMTKQYPRDLDGYDKDAKVLIAAPIGGHKQYSMHQWLQWIADQEHENIEVVICCNGEFQDELLMKVNASAVTHNNGKIVPLYCSKLGNDGNLTRNHRITLSREKIREFAMQRDYDALFFVDTDTIPPLDAIKQLMNLSAEATSGLYYYKDSNVPVAMDAQTGTNFDNETLKESFEKHEPITGAAGMGCFMMRGDAKKIPFRYDSEKRSEDLLWCEDAALNYRIAVWIAPWVICKHLKDKV